MADTQDIVREAENQHDGTDDKAYDGNNDKRQSAISFLSAKRKLIVAKPLERMDFHLFQGFSGIIEGALGAAVFARLEPMATVQTITVFHDPNHFTKTMCLSGQKDSGYRWDSA